jgi:CMP/dCMP kinase
MKYRVLTISREYGSGGGDIAEIISQNLGWKLVDKDLILEISRMEQVTEKEVASFDEKVDPWLHRISRSILGLSVDGISPIVPPDLFDAKKAALVARRVIEEAYRIGNCVIVGRGSQCVLRNRDDVFHAFVYAGWPEKVLKIRSRVPPGTNVEAMIRSMNTQRMDYIRFHYKENWLNPCLYDIMLDSKGLLEKASQLIIAAMKMSSE